MKTREKLNDINSFLKGFKIRRGDKIIALTQEEMAEFRELDTAIDGQNVIQCFLDNFTDSQAQLAEKIMNDEDICFNLQMDILDELFSESGEIEYEIIQQYIQDYERRK